MKCSIIGFWTLLNLQPVLAQGMEFLPGSIAKRGTTIELRAHCAVSDAITSKCILVNLFLTGMTEANHFGGVGQTLPPQQITAFPIAIDDIKKFKVSGFLYNFTTLDGSAMTAELEGIQYVFAPLTAAADLIGYTATPFFLVAKSIENRKYNRFLRAYKNSQDLTMGRQPFEILTDEICKSGYLARQTLVAGSNGIDLTVPSHEEARRLAILMKAYHHCGVNL